MWSGCFVKGTRVGRASRWAAEGPQRGFSVCRGLFQSLQMSLCIFAETDTEIAWCTVRSLLLECPLDDEAVFSLSEGGEHFKAPLSELLSGPAQIPFSVSLLLKGAVCQRSTAKMHCVCPWLCSCSLEN